MKTIALTLVTLASLGAAASAQERLALGSDATLARSDAPPAYLEEERSRDAYFHEPDPLSVPRALAAPDHGDEPKYSPFSLGASGGYMRARGSDDGTWFGGVQARLRFGILAAEASIQFHQNKYENGDVVVTQYPVQVTAFLYPLPDGPFRPYILGGVGWYYTRVDHRGLFDIIEDTKDHVFGEHFGAGAELFLGPRVSFDADVRYIFLNPKTDQVIDRDFNYWQVTLGLNFFF